MSCFLYSFVSYIMFFNVSWCLKCERWYLSSEIRDGGEEAGEVWGNRRSSLLIELSDLQLQLPVGCLQGAHLHTQPEADVTQWQVTGDRWQVTFREHFCSGSKHHILSGAIKGFCTNPINSLLSTVSKCWQLRLQWLYVEKTAAHIVRDWVMIDYLSSCLLG